MKFIQFTFLLLALWLTAVDAQTTEKIAVENLSDPYTSYNDSVLWKVTGNGLKQPSYVFGSWHFLCRNEIIFKNKVKVAISNTEQLLIQNFITYLQTGDYYTDLAANSRINKGVEIYKIDDRKQRKKLLKLIRSELDLKIDHAKRVMPVLKRMTPFEVFFSSMHSFIKDCDGLGSFDQLLFDHFQKKKSQIGSINNRKKFEESLLDSGFVNPESLIAYIENIESQRALVKEMKAKYYQSESLDELKQLYRIFLTNDHNNAERIDQYILGQDVSLWVQKMNDWMIQKPTFISVNASYLIGENGILAKLEEQGFKLEPIVD